MIGLPSKNPGPGGRRFKSYSASPKDEAKIILERLAQLVEQRILDCSITMNMAMNDLPSK